MTDAIAAVAPSPFEGASELQRENASLLEAIDRRLGDDSRPESEAAALRELEPRIHAFLDRGAATGVFVEDVRERTACQVLLDYWSSTLAHAGIAAARARLASFDAAQLPDLKDRQCPFVGLEAIRDGTLFFGREKAVASLLARVAEVPLVVVLGASGSGKSSLVIGGALPLLAEPGHVPPYRIVGPLTPGNTPLESLVGAVAAVAPAAAVDVAAEVANIRNDPAHLVRTLHSAGETAILLVVDQFEEVFTLCSDSDRTAFVASLDALLRAHPNDRVILTLREEFSSELDKLEPLWPYLARARFSMKEYSMGYDELKAAVERPAALVNLQFAPGIVDKMVRSVLGRDTALPLLQFALQSLWKLRDRNRITHEVYAKIGSSPLVALERFADGFYDSLPRESKDEVERILLELVRVDRMLEPYREPRLRSELLAGGNPRTSEVLDLLEREDFVRSTPTAGGVDAAVEVKHEALLRNWPRYIDWINGKRERVRQRIALTETAQRWSEGGRSTTERLLSPWQLKEVEHLPDLSPLEAEYVRVSAEAADRDRLAREEALRRRERRRWTAVFGSVVLAMVVLAGWYVALQSERRAAYRQAAQIQMQLVRAGDASMRGHLAESLPLSLRALAGLRDLEGKTASALPRTQARETLVSTMRQAADLRRLFVADAEDAVFQTVAFHPTRPEALLAYAGADGRTYVSGLDAPVAQSLDSCGTATTTAVAFDPPGRLLAAGCSDGTLSVWATDDWRRLGGGNKRVFERKIWTIAVSPDGRLIAAGGYHNRVALVALAEDGAPTDAPPVAAGGTTPVGYVWSLAFSPAGDTLLVGDGVGQVLACKAAAAAAWDCAKTASVPGDAEDAIRALAYAPDGSRIAVGHWTGRVEVWDANFHPASRVQIAVGESRAPVHSVAFFEACGRRLLAIGQGTELWYRPADAPASSELPADCTVRRSASVGDEVYGIAVHAPSGRVAAATRGGYVAVVDPKGGADPLRSVVTPTGAKQGVALRGTIVAEEGSTSWLAAPIVSRRSGEANLALRRLHDGVVDGDDFVRLAAGDGTIERLSASRQSRQLAALGCFTDTDAASCSRGVTVWRLGDGLTRLAPVMSIGARDFGGVAVPSRIALSPDGNWLVVAFETGRRLLLLSVADGGTTRTWIESELQPVREIAFSHDGRLFGAGGGARQPGAGTGADRVQVWDVVASGLQPTRHSLPALSPSANKVHELAFAADRQGHPLVLAGGESGAIDQWDVGSGRMLPTLRADSWPIYLMDFSAAASLLAAADMQNVVRVWDTSSWIPLQLTPPSDRFERPGFLGFVGDGAWLASGASTLQVWDLGVGSLQRKLCALLRAPGQHGADSPVPLWHPDDLCRTQ